jgi:replicative DNA helicase
MNANVLELRTPPHSLEAEQAVLGGLMLDNQGWDQVADRLAADDFYRLDHRVIFGAMVEMSVQSQPFDAITLSEWLKNRGQLDDAGGLSYLATLVRDTPTAENVKAYADIVRERSVLRGIAKIGSRLTQEALSPVSRTSADLIELAEREVFELAERGNRTGRGAAKLGSLMPGLMDRLDMLLHSDTHVTGVATGITQFDELTAGLQPGDLVIIAGRPSMGKTALAMGIAEHASIRSDKPVASVVFSMEMSAEQLAMRLASSIGRIDQQKLRTGRMDDPDWKRFASATTIMAKAPIYIDDTGGLTPTDLRARARRMKREFGIGLVVVDYLQLMSVTGTSENRATEISEICRNLKALARELAVPVIALSQLNRALEQRPNKRPIMSDLRESGSIEQDADVIVFVYRDEVYDKESDAKGVAELIIGKQRNGPTDTVYTTFLGQFTRFENRTPEVQ